MTAQDMTAASSQHKFADKLQLILAKVTAHWTDQQLPLGYRQAVLGHTSRMDTATRLLFEMQVASHPQLRIMQTKRGSRYVFPDPVANQISEEQMIFAMQQLERLRRAESNQSRYERRHELRHDDVATPLPDSSTGGSTED